jgi:hypothetical protein
MVVSTVLGDKWRRVELIDGEMTKKQNNIRSKNRLYSSRTSITFAHHQGDMRTTACHDAYCYMCHTRRRCMYKNGSNAPACPLCIPGTC